MPEVITLDRLRQIGVSEGLLTKAWVTLEFLGLVRGKGETTELFRAIRFASNEEYPKVLLGILRDAYAEVFSVVDPATANIDQLDSAFRLYVPGGQRRRMITLFLGLCRDVGIEPNVEQRARSSSIGGRKSTDARPRTKKERTTSDSSGSGGAS